MPEHCKCLSHVPSTWEGFFCVRLSNKTTWAFSNFCFIITDCYLISFLLLQCILVENLPISHCCCCYYDCVSLISCWGTKYTFCTQTNIQTICSDKYPATHSVHTHRQEHNRCVFTDRSLQCYPQSLISTPTDKQWENPDHNLQGKDFLSACYLTGSILTHRGTKWDKCICLFLDGIDLRQAAANVRKAV